MKMEELRPCDNCDGPVRMVFHVVRTSHAVVNAQAARNAMAMEAMFAGHPVARAFDSHGDDAIQLVAETELDGKKVGWSEILLCSDCALAEINVMMLTQKVNEREETTS